MYRKLFVVLGLTLIGLVLSATTANAWWSEFSYSNLPGDTLLAELSIDSVTFDSVESKCGPIIALELGFFWDPQAVCLDTIISYDGIFSGWGGLIYSVDSALGSSLLAGAGAYPISQHGIILSAKFLYLDTFTWDSAKQWCHLSKEYVNEGCHEDVNEQSPNMPDQFILKQNYPNPFNPTTDSVYSEAELPQSLQSNHNYPVPSCAGRNSNAEHL